MTHSVEWAKLTAPEIRAVAARPDAFVLLPVGSLEQHGPHLPTITDTASAAAVAIRAAELVAGDPPVLVLPGMWTGMSEHHLPFGGTISLNLAEFCGVLRGVVRSLRAVGFRRLLIVNGHGGNIDPLAVATRELAHEFVVKFLVVLLAVRACVLRILAVELALVVELFRGGEIVHLTAAEAGLLSSLAARAGEAVSREDLSQSAQFGGNVRNVDVQMTRLRRKIEPDPRYPRYLQTVRGTGYALKPE